MSGFGPDRHLMRGEDLISIWVRADIGGHCQCIANDLSANLAPSIYALRMIHLPSMLSVFVDIASAEALVAVPRNLT
jgi:hypothetical protein